MRARLQHPTQHVQINHARGRHRHGADLMTGETSAVTDRRMFDGRHQEQIARCLVGSNLHCRGQRQHVGLGAA
jgi:hypothetical protein